MIYFSFADQGSDAPVLSVLDAVEREAAMSEVQERLRAAPCALEAHVFDGDLFVGTVQAPAFGFAGVNNTTALSGPSETSMPEPHPGGVRV